jgi:hypothetical protein
MTPFPCTAHEASACAVPFRPAGRHFHSITLWAYTCTTKSRVE